MKIHPILGSDGPTVERVWSSPREERVRGYLASLLIILRKTWLRLVVLIAAAFVVHLPSLQGQLIWDDTYLVGENPFFRAPIFSLEVFRHHLFLDSSSGHYRPVQNLSYMLDYFVWNGNLYGYHLSNILWHAAAGVLLFFLLRKLVASWMEVAPANSEAAGTGAWLVALIWVLHPVHSAAVDYISGRADSLAFVFSCGAWLLYLRASTRASRSVGVSRSTGILPVGTSGVSPDESVPEAASLDKAPGRMPGVPTGETPVLRGTPMLREKPVLRAAGYTGAALLFLLSLCSREIAVIWGVLFGIHLLFFGKKFSARHRLFALTVCAFVLVAYGGLRSLTENRNRPAAAAGWGAPARAGLVLRALGDYAGLTIWPANLHMERTLLEERMFKSPPTWRDQFAFGRLTLLGLLAGGFLLAGLWKRGLGRPLRIFGAVWFTTGFLPISNLVELNATSAEHWLYLPLVGLLLVGLGWLIELPQRGLQWAAALSLIFAAALGARSTVRSSDWLNSQHFYERTIATGGWSPRVALNLAFIYGNQGRLAESRRLLERTLASWPDYPQAQSYLSVILREQGAVAAADRLLARAATPSPAQKEYPRSWVAALQLARTKFSLHQSEEALRVLAVATAAEPKVWPLAKMQAEILQKEGRVQSASQIIQDFADRNWWQYPAYLALGKLKAQQGDGPGALAALRHACRLDIRETEALNLMARIEMRAENLPAALAAQERAVSRQPDEPSQYILYSEVLLQMGRTEQAQKARATAARLKEDQASA